MKQDKRMEQLLELRWQHVEQVRLFHIQETKTLADLNRLYRLEVAEPTTCLAYAKKVGEHVDALRALALERTQGYQTLKRHQYEEVDNLLRYKSLHSQ